MSDTPTTPLPGSGSSIKEIAEQILVQHKRALERLENLRAQRDQLNAAIRDAVQEEAEARRIAASLQPRKRAAK